MCVNGFMTVSYYVLIARLTLTGSVACSCYQHGTLLSPPIGVERKPRASFPWQDRVIGSAFLVVTSYYSIKLIEIPRLHRESELLDVQWMWIGTAALSIQRDTGTIVDTLVPVHRILFSCLVPSQAIERIKVYKASSAVRRTCVNFTLRRVYFVSYKLWTAATADTNTVFFSFPCWAANVITHTLLPWPLPPVIKTGRDYFKARAMEHHVRTTRVVKTRGCCREERMSRIPFSKLVSRPVQIDIKK